MVLRDSLFLVCFLATISTLAQTYNDIPDSLLIKEYDYFIEKLESHSHDPAKANVYGKAYLEKAKGEQNWEETAAGFKALLHLSPTNKQLAYADSIIYASRKTNHNPTIASSFLTRGIVYFNLKEHSKALDNFLVANNFLSKEHDDYLKNKVIYNIAKVKYLLGFYSEALSLFKRCTAYFKEEEDLAYLVSLHHLGLCYLKLDEFLLCSTTNNLGIREAFRIEFPTAVPHFIHSEGINQYHQKNYGAAILKLQQVLPDIINSKDDSNESLAYLYIGKSYWKLKQYAKAVPYFKKVDVAFQSNKFFQPDLRENYEYLIDYYRSKEDLKNQLLYTNKLLAADKLLDKNYAYLSEKIHKEYNTEELQASKSQIEQSLKTQKFRGKISSVIILALLIFVDYLFNKHLENRLYKRKYNEYISGKSNVKPKITKELTSKHELTINPQVIESILNHLDIFENDKVYLEKDLKQEKLAELFGSNPKYVSQIILHYKNKKSNEYINDLKVDHMIDLLHKDKKFRHYTHEAMANEVGFGTTQHFTRAFLIKTGVKVSYYIKQLDLEDRIKVI